MSVSTIDFGTRTQARARDRSSSFTPAQAHELLGTKFAPWVQELGLRVEECSFAGARLRLPYSPTLTRAGRTICGQALMACADSAMAIAIASAFGEFRNVTTVNQSMSFMRAVANADVLIDAIVQKLGKSLVFGEVYLTSSGSDDIAAHATATWALIP
jgi:acyl-coenzyme A thioesterase PaaI-like protein